jgi:DNA-binding XRE family transcriptional regulator
MELIDIANFIGVTELNVWKIEEGKYSFDTDILHKYLMVLDATLIIER